MIRGRVAGTTPPAPDVPAQAPSGGAQLSCCHSVVCSSHEVAVSVGRWTLNDGRELTVDE